MRCRKGGITISMKEAKRLQVVRHAIENRITHAEAAEVIALDLRQVQRLAARIMQVGDRGTCHRGRGKYPNNLIPIPEKVQEKVLSLFRGIYYELGSAHVRKRLLEHNRVKVNVKILRTLFIKEELPYRKRTKRSPRQ
jgi:hypothetical protein